MMMTEIYEELLTEVGNQRRLSGHKGKEKLQRRNSAGEYESSDEKMYRVKISQLELKLADQTSEHNDKVCKLQESLTKLTASFEKIELQKQKLQYDLTLSQQEINKQKRSNTEQIEKSQKQIDSLNEEITQLNVRLQTAGHQLKENQSNHMQQLENVKASMHHLEAVIGELETEKKRLFEEKNSAESLALTWKRKCEEIQEKCDLFERQTQDHSETVRKLIKDSEFASAKDEERVSDIQELQKRVKALQENVEAERAAHLETKFNTEVLQLKSRDTDKELQVEKARLNECRTNLQNMNTKYRNLEDICSKERGDFKQLQMEHQKLQDDLSRHNKQMKEKDKHLNGITSEVENYGKHLKELMTELDETKQKLLDAENTCNSTKSELTFLLNNYKVIAEIATSPVKKKEWNFSDLTEKIRKLFESYQNKLTSLEAKCQESAQMIVKLTDECSDHREMGWNKDRALEEAEYLVKTAQENLAKCQAKSAGYEEKVQRLQGQIENLQRVIVEKDEKFSVLNEASALDNLQVIYEVLMTNELPKKSPSKQNKMDVREMKDFILSRIKDDHQNFKIMQDKIIMSREQLQKTQEELQQHKSGIKKLQKLNSQVLTETERSLKESHEIREKEKERCEQEIKLLNSKLQQTDQRLSLILQQYDGASIDDFPYVLQKINEFHELKHSSSALINVLTSSLWGLLFQHHLLAYQKRLLSQVVNKVMLVKNGTYEIARTLQDEMMECGDKHSSGLPSTGVFRFRIVTIIILAANRLSKIGFSTCSVRLNQKPSYGHNGLLFYNMKAINEKNGLEKDVWSNVRQSLSSVVSGNLLKEASALVRSDNDSFENLPSSLSRYYSNYLQTISRTFKGSSLLSLKEDSSKNSLIQGLRRGLNSQLRRYGHDYVACEEIVEMLRKSVLDFTSKLHRAESEKVTLKNELERYREGRNRYKHELELERTEVAALKIQEQNLRNQIVTLTSSLERMVCEEQMKNVCTDLKNALKREDELQSLFEKQIEQIKEMENRIERHEGCSERKHDELADALTALKKTQSSVVRRDDTIKELRHFLSELKREKMRLEKTMEKQQERIGVFMCDREILARYMRHATSTLYNTKKRMNESVEAIDDALKELVPKDLLNAEGERKNPEMQLVQNTVLVFFDAQRESLMRVSVLLSQNDELLERNRHLESELIAHQRHIKTLKDRVSALFTQDINGQQKNSLVSGAVSMPTHDPIFIPLQEH